MLILILIQNLKRHWRLYTAALLIALIASAGIYLAAYSLGIGVKITEEENPLARPLPLLTLCIVPDLIMGEVILVGGNFFQ